jgi:probable rRNA maturation factor
MISLAIENKTGNFTPDEVSYKEIISSALEKLNLESNIIIELIFVDNSEIRELNKTYRSKDAATDVLSFPQEQFEVKENILGSIVIAPDVAAEKNEEITELVKHGLLHLLGYDHEEDEEKWDNAAKIINCKY